MLLVLAAACSSHFSMHHLQEGLRPQESCRRIGSGPLDGAAQRFATRVLHQIIGIERLLVDVKPPSLTSRFTNLHSRPSPGVQYYPMRCCAADVVDQIDAALVGCQMDIDEGNDPVAVVVDDTNRLFESGG